MTEGGQVLSIPASRKVIKVDDCGCVIAKFNSIRDAAISSNVNEKSVWYACNRSKTHFSGGYFWYYASDLPVDLNTNIGVQNRGKTNWKGHRTYLGKPVECYTKDGIYVDTFSSATQAQGGYEIMADFKDIVRLAVDAYHGTPTKYSVGESMDVLRQAMVEANGGSTFLDYKAIRDGKCNGLFTLVEEILARTVVEGLQGDEYFNALVDFRNVALGDKNEFVVEDSNLFVVSDAADGTQGIRRQRLGGQTKTSIPTTFKVVKIYDELNRVLSGQVDFNKFIQSVAESFRKKLKALIGQFYKILPIKESGEPSLGKYMNSLQREMIGCQSLIIALNNDELYLSLLAVLQYLIENDCDTDIVKSEVFKAISICKKLQKKYGIEEV